MGRINTVPVGLQSLMGNTNFGNNPSELAEISAPTIDLAPFLGAYKVGYARNAASLNSTGPTGTGVEVPEGKVWIPIATTVYINGFDAAGDIINLWAELREAPGLPTAAPRFAFLQTGRITANAVFDVHAITYTWPRWGVMLQGGTKMNMYVGNITTSGTISCEIGCMYYEFDA